MSTRNLVFDTVSSLITVKSVSLIFIEEFVWGVMGEVITIKVM